MVEVVVHFNVEVAEFFIISKCIAEGDHIAPVVLLAVDRIGHSNMKKQGLLLPRKTNNRVALSWL